MAIDATKKTIHSLDKLKIGTVEVGYISDEGLSPSGSEATYQPVYTAQNPGAPVELILTQAGQMAYDFVLIQLDGTNMKLVMGGTVDAATGAWSPGDTCDIETPITIECGSGHTIEIERAKLSGSFANAINRKGVLGYKCKIQVLQPTDATKKAITITPPQAGS